MKNKETYDSMSLSDAIYHLEIFREYQFPKRTRKPQLTNTNPSKEEVDLYLKQTSEYEALNSSYKENIRLYNEEQYQISEYIINRIKEDSGLNELVPEQYRNNVYAYAYDRSRGDGYYEVYITLCNLVDIFKVK